MVPNCQDENGRGNQKYHLQKGMGSLTVELLYRQTAIYKSLYWVLTLQQETRRFLTSTINNTALGTF